MTNYFLGRYSWPFVALGGLLAIACLASMWYINRLQSDLARAVRHDATRMDAADELQVQLRHLRFHSVMFAAGQSGERQSLVRDSMERAENALDAIHRDVPADDLELLSTIERDYHLYKSRQGPNGFPAPARSLADLIRWSDEHRIRELLELCRELSDRQQERMTAALARSEAQTSWAGRVLLGLGLVGALGGLLAGFATARGLTRRAAQLSVRVQAVQAQLDQEVGAMTVEAPKRLEELDAQLDRVVGRVTEVCQRLQEQERDLLRAEQLAAVGHLAAGVAHEVRNPLTGIKFLVEAAMRPAAATPLTVEDLSLIRQEIARIERTVQDLLDYARTPRPDRRPHDLRDIVEAAVEVVRSRAERKGVFLRLEMPREELEALVDRDQLLSLLTNLLANAVDAGPPGSEVIVCAAFAGIHLTVEISDSGPGIDPAIAGKLFTPFTTTKPTGTGLGLTVSQRIARDHGGSIGVANRSGGGARFTLTLPAGAESHAEVAGR